MTEIIESGRSQDSESHDPDVDLPGCCSQIGLFYLQITDYGPCQRDIWTDLGGLQFRSLWLCHVTLKFALPVGQEKGENRPGQDVI